MEYNVPGDHDFIDFLNQTKAEDDDYTDQEESEDEEESEDDSEDEEEGDVKSETKETPANRGFRFGGRLCRLEGYDRR